MKTTLFCALFLGLMSCGSSPSDLNDGVPSTHPGSTPTATDPAPPGTPGSAPAGARAAFDPARTITVYVHGWDLKGSVAVGPVGGDNDGGSLVAGIIKHSGLPLGTTNPTAPNQIVGTEYYGKQLPSYYTAADIMQVNALSGIPRYALIVAKYVRHVLGRSGAVGANLTCHSMGCEISRYLIEHDLEQLASDHLLQRWATFSGVVNGATLASIDSADLNLLARLLGLNLVDVVDMGYPWVQADVAIFDHQRVNGDNPNFGGMIIHHIQSTNPHVDTALGIPLLDAFGHGDEPNDGILLDAEQYFHAQTAAAELELPSGALVSVSASHHYADHFQITDLTSAQAMAAAGLIGAQRVRVTLSSATLTKDLLGGPFHKLPASVAVESNVDYPFLSAIDGTSPLLDEVAMDRRNAPVLQMPKGQTLSPGLTIFYGPVFPQQTTLHVVASLQETDYYPAGGIKDNPLSSPKTLVSFDQVLPLAAGSYPVSSPDGNFTLEVSVDQLY